MRRIAVLILFISLLIPVRAGAQVTTAEDERIRKLDAEVERMREQQKRMESALEELRDNRPERADWPVKVGAEVTIRFDRTEVEDQTDLLLEDDEVEGMRAKARLSVDYNPEGLLAAGLRLSLAENPNPSSSFVRLGDSFLTKSFDLDRFFIVYRPLPFYRPLAVTVGKMPLGFWAGDRGPFRSEMIWDSDINPEGVSLEASIPTGLPFFSITNLAGYFTLNEVTDGRFLGLTGDTYLLADQLRLALHPGPIGGTLAVAIYDYHHLNAGLRVPNFTPGSGAFVDSGTSALLLQPGLQRTNNQINYGPGAVGFVDGRFVPINATGQIYVTLPPSWLRPLGLDDLNPELFWLGDYVENLSVEHEDNGYGITGGVRGGGKGVVGAFNLWYTYRNVDADATLATFADSDLGAGTGYKGFEFGANYAILSDLFVQFSYFDFEGFPNKDNGVTRMFIDLIRRF